MDLKKNVELRVIGEGPYLKNIKNMASDLESVGVKITDFKDPYQLPYYLSDCHIGICSYRSSNSLAHQTIPGKLYEYMACGLAILSSNRKAVKRIIEEESCGVVYESSDQDEILGKIDELVSDGKKRRKLMQNSRQAVLEKYNWKKNRHITDIILS